MRYPLMVLAAAMLAMTACASTEQGARRPLMPRTTAPTWSDRIVDWPEPAQKAARQMGQRYGAPHEVTDTELVWFGNGPWKRTILSREGRPHEWPEPHVDVLEQVIDLRVDPKRADDIERFNGSVIVDRTKGELSARCGREAANFLAINLARDIATGKRSDENARAFYEQAIADAAAGQKPEEMRRLMFVDAEGATEDRDSRATAAENQAAKRKAAAASEQSVKRASP
jgi:hypothetical protein